MIDGKPKEIFLQQAETLCRESNASLLFLTLFGSSLYGTETPGKSDVDIRGIFLPLWESLALNAAPKNLHFSTGSGDRRNTADDVDIDLWFLQHWLLKLLPAGYTGALDVLFSPSHAACTLFRDFRLDGVFTYPLKLLDAKNGHAYAEYSLGQAKKYGIKGSRIGALKGVYKWLQANCLSPAPEIRLKDIIDSLAANCSDGRFCTQQTVQGEPALQLCGKMHMGSIRVGEFTRRVESDMQRYGARASEAEQNQGVDFKALSHALRALDQMEELLKTGKIIFPLKSRDELIAVKQGALPWLELEQKILARLAEIDKLRESLDFVGHFDKDFAEARILACYGDASLTPQIYCENIFQDGFTVPTATLDLIQRKLTAAEHENKVKILYACESGSRSWGFASEDSDFDVRFVYVHEPEWYLGVAPEEKRDVLELGIEDTPVGELDINGWELRKTLKLFRLSNPPLLEWLSSPLIYRECGTLASLLRAAAPGSISPIRSWHHYRSLMEKSSTRYWEKKPSIKAWFYLLRPLLAMRWIELDKSVSPMRFDLLMDGVVRDASLRVELDALVDMKKRGAESDGFTPPPLVAAFVYGELERLRISPPDLKAETQRADLDTVFRTVLASAWQQESK
jgi:predicted nucleotidyltransferase